MLPAIFWIYARVLIIVYKSGFREEGFPLLVIYTNSIVLPMFRRLHLVKPPHCLPVRVSVRMNAHSAAESDVLHLVQMLSSVMPAAMAEKLL